MIRISPQEQKEIFIIADTYGMKDNITPEDIQKMFDMSKGDNFGSVLMMLAIMSMFSSPKPNREAEYWRGAYDALKELIENESITGESLDKS